MLQIGVPIRKRLTQAIDCIVKSQVASYNFNMYVPRRLEGFLRQANAAFPVLMVTGPRQSGKTTLLQHLREPERRFVSLDDLDMRRLAQDDPKLFLARFPPPLVIDEFQYAPDLLPYIKIAVDELRTRGHNEEAAGMYWLTGSQQFVLMRHVRESLAGRVAIFNLLGFEPAELAGVRPGGPTVFDASMDDIVPWAERPAPRDVFSRIINGSMPGFLTTGADADTRRQYYSSYVQTYLERDVSAIDGIRNLRGFELCFRLLAARAGQLVNYADLARDVGVSAMTIRAWLAILERSFHVITIAPYYRSLSKRLVKTPKVYFLDSGLHAWLTGWNDPDTALSGPLAGSLFENWVVGLLVRGGWHRGTDHGLSFWRTTTGQEVDIWRESAGRIDAAEVKLRAGGEIASIARRAFGSLDSIDPSPFAWGRRLLFTLGDRILPLDPQTWQVPVQYIG